MRPLTFDKMHGLGNDFMVIDGVHQPLDFGTEHIRQWADRHTGIGFDQLLLVEASSQPDADFRYRIFNADGSEVGQCGNGARCLARFIHQHQLSERTKLRLALAHHTITAHCLSGDRVRVHMGHPEWRPEHIPLSLPLAPAYHYSMDHQSVEFGAVSMGNPHAVITVDDLAQAPIATVGPWLQQQACFPQSVNVGFMERITPQHIRLRVWERGVGETQACGSGACAAVAVGIQQQVLQSPVTVELTGGSLVIEWQDDGIWMTGPAVTVYQGTLFYDPLSEHPSRL